MEDAYPDPVISVEEFDGDEDYGDPMNHPPKDGKSRQLVIQVKERDDDVTYAVYSAADVSVAQFDRLKNYGEVFKISQEQVAEILKEYLLENHGMVPQS